jgi:hypothetical protein
MIVFRFSHHSEQELADIADFPADFRLETAARDLDVLQDLVQGAGKFSPAGHIA